MISMNSCTKHEVSVEEACQPNTRKGLLEDTVTETKASEWWQSLNVRLELEDCLGKLNDAHDATNPIDAYRMFSEALNQLWSGKNRVDNDRNRTDNQSIQDLLMSMPAERQETLCDAVELKDLAGLVPQIMSVKCLRASERYTPGEAIPNGLASKASAEHRQFANALQAWCSNRSVESRLTTLKKLAALLYIVRSNIAHGEKTMRGPDIEKANRDKLVCTTSVPTIKSVVECLLDFPSKKLVAYGTLQPSKVNHSVLEPLTVKEWTKVQIEGKFTERQDGLRSFKWRESSTRQTAMLLKSPQLPSFWTRLDEFEGAGYKRILVTALAGEEASVAMTYQDIEC